MIDRSSKFAFSTLNCPGWDLASVAVRAKEIGFSGVELFGSLRDPTLNSTNLFLSDPIKIRSSFDSQGIQVACVAGDIAMTGRARDDAVLAADLRHFIDTAHRLGCPLVKVLDIAVPPGRSRSAATVMLGDWLMALGDYAADRQVSIVVTNSLTFRRANEMWSVLDRLNHPSIACCWDIFRASLAGESPSVSVPVLNQKIQNVHAKDAQFTAQGAIGCRIGQGDVPIEKALTRLRGIGYQGYVTLAWEPGWVAAAAEAPEASLPEALAVLRRWVERSDDKPRAKARTS